MLKKLAGLALVVIGAATALGVGFAFVSAARPHALVTPAVATTPGVPTVAQLRVFAQEMSDAVAAGDETSGPAKAGEFLLQAKASFYNCEVLVASGGADSRAYAAGVFAEVRKNYPQSINAMGISPTPERTHPFYVVILGADCQGKHSGPPVSK